MKLWLVRHAQPLSPPGLCYGRLDVAADPAATQALAHQLASQLPVGLQLKTSPSKRCAGVARALHARRADLPSDTDDRLQELDFGTWEGRTWDEIGRVALDAWDADFEHHRPGGGESMAMFLQRLGSALECARQSDAAQAWITHAGVIRAVRLLAGGVRNITSAADWPSAPIPFGSIDVLEV